MRALVAGLFVLSSACATARTAYQIDPQTQIVTLRHDYANAHVVARGDNYFLVDAGIEANAPMLEADLRTAGFDPAKLRAIVITHGHADHAGGAAYFRQKYQIPVVAGQGDAELLAKGKNDELCPTDEEARSRLAEYQSATYTPIESGVWVTRQLDLRPLTGIPARAIAMPGHTQGSIVVVVGEAVLVGDLFRGSLASAGAARHFYMCDLEDNTQDIKQLLEIIAPNARRFFTGHFGPVDRRQVAEAFTPGKP